MKLSDAVMLAWRGGRLKGRYVFDSVLRGFMTYRTQSHSAERTSIDMTKHVADSHATTPCTDLTSTVLLC